MRQAVHHVLHLLVEPHPGRSHRPVPGARLVRALQCDVASDVRAVLASVLLTDVRGPAIAPLPDDVPFLAAGQCDRAVLATACALDLVHGPPRFGPEVVAVADRSAHLVVRHGLAHMVDALATREHLGQRAGLDKRSDGEAHGCNAHLVCALPEPARSAVGLLTEARFPERAVGADVFLALPAVKHRLTRAWTDGPGPDQVPATVAVVEDRDVLEHAGQSYEHLVIGSHDLPSASVSNNRN